MNEYKQAQLEPFKPHQCMHWNTDGIRCRAYARHNEYTCFQHRIPDEPSIPIVANEPFTLPSLRTRDGICEALDAIAAHLAGKTIDDRRANLLLYTIQLASQQHPRPIQPGAPGSTVSPSTLGLPSQSAVEGPAAPTTAAGATPRKYDETEEFYLDCTYRVGGKPFYRERPETLTQEDVEAYVARRRAADQAKAQAKAEAKAQVQAQSATIPAANQEQTTESSPTLQPVAAQPATDNLQPATPCPTAASNKPSPHRVPGTAAPLPGTPWSERIAALPSPGPDVSGAASRGTAGTPPRSAAYPAGRRPC